MPQGNAEELASLLEEVIKLQYEVTDGTAEEWKGQVRSLVASSEGKMADVAGVIQQMKDQSKANFDRIKNMFGPRKSVAGTPGTGSSKPEQPVRRGSAYTPKPPQLSFRKGPSPAALAAKAAYPVQAMPAVQEETVPEAPMVAQLSAEDTTELMRFSAERLGAMKIGELNKMARNLGINEDDRDVAMDAEDQKAAFIKIIQAKQKPSFDEKAARENLSTMRVGELTKLARSLGVHEDARDEALDADDQVKAFVDLIVPLQKAKAEAA